MDSKNFTLDEHKFNVQSGVKEEKRFDQYQFDTMQRNPFVPRRSNVMAATQLCGNSMGSVQIKREYDEVCKIEEKRIKYNANVELNTQFMAQGNGIVEMNTPSLPMPINPLASYDENPRIDQNQTKSSEITVDILSSLEDNVGALIASSKSTCDALNAELQAMKEKYENGNPVNHAKNDELAAQLKAMRLEAESVCLGKMERMKEQFQADFHKKLWDYQEKTEKEHNRRVAELQCNHVIEIENGKEQFNAQMERLKMEHAEQIAEMERDMQDLILKKDTIEGELTDKYKKIVIGIRRTAAAERAQLEEKSKATMRCICCGEDGKENLVCSKPCAQMWNAWKNMADDQ
ncbi:uncharacterized protein LOC116350416 [Contarinia nasturtii]|uniref:uncharacterized protein LOC116350416 n=1 Tax=Contarinia nasturtii TaxID=265458 RepID=UPI0012D3CAD4|nr:uncharacterized protein LOC116350416 [Contarinia nasturtii]